MSARAQRQPLPNPARSSSDFRGAGRVCLGRIVGAKGLKGELRVRAYTERARDIAAYGPVEDETGRRSFALSVVSETEGGAIVRLKGVADRTAAEKLKGMALYVPRERLPPLPEGEYYHGDLIGLDAVDESGRGLGRVRAIRDYGAGAILEIEDGLWPAGAIAAVDLRAGKIVLTQPAELIAHNEKGKH
ncbi:MAG: 16S rRNA processing protein RimM [Acidimicrobiia bacterium]|nr:16S rRNA processing protein RimM [Acidimicrobiia bacterium]